MTGVLVLAWKFILLGLGCGMLSGLFGVGAGILMVPAFVFLLGLTQKSAQAMSLMIMVPMALAGAFRYRLDAGVQANVGVAAVVAIGGVIGALAGASIAVELPGSALRKLFAGFLLLVSIYMFTTPERQGAVPGNENVGTVTMVGKGDARERNG